ncbi:MAG TPA: hypothetical protein RMH99_12740 [Sandaracinaceae bacterium LLY-WYZ-13_1]|nr:hypothetical protein [Sandaracinaceae bacterium LLY-WYZ-13_1]
MARSVVAAVTCAVLWALLGAAPARAQMDMEMDAPTTYQDSTGLTWSVATLEAGLLLTVAASAAAGEENQAVGLVALGATVVGSAVSSGVAQATNAPVEPPMVFHHGFIGGALLGGLLSFSTRLAGGHPDLVAGLGVGGLLAGAAGAATYSVLRMDRLAHDPELLEEAHVLSWVPAASAGLLTAILGMAGLRDEAPLIGAITGLVGLGISVAFVEVALSEHPPPDERAMMTGMPLYAAEF